MFDDEDARVPFAVLGVLLLIVSTIVTVYLASMESISVSQGIGDDQERDLSKALTLAVSDLGTALNYAGIAAEAEVGKSPVVNVSNDSSWGRGTISADDERIKYIAWRELSKYLEANYNGSFTYGDYEVSATLTGDYRSLTIIPGNMTLGRKFNHPVVACGRDYAGYYTMTVPVRLTVGRMGSDFNYSEDRVIRSLITARYPLLRDLTGEFERRLNGTPLSLDLTAASFALTWARGYAQYSSGSPLNIIDNAQLEPMVNGALLTEEGFEYNSVDPTGLAMLAGKCLGIGDRPAAINSYNVSSNSEADLPANNTTAPPESYTFDVDAMVDRAHENVSTGSYAENTLAGAYTMQMYVRIDRERDCYPRINTTIVTEEKSEPDTSVGPGTGPLLTRTFRVYRDDSDGKGFADRVTVTYYRGQYSLLRYAGAEKYAESSGSTGDPVLAGSSDDVASPFSQYLYQRDLEFGHKAFTDDNLRDAVKWYETSFDRPGETGSFERTLAGIIGDRDGWQTRIPEAFSDRSYEFVCGPDNRHPIWTEIMADYELRDLGKIIKKDTTVDLDPESYGGSPSAMTSAAYGALRDRFRDCYDMYLDRQSYFCTPPPGDYCHIPAYSSCGSKAIFHLRQAFLTDILRQLEDAADNAGESIERAIDERMNGTGLSTKDLTAGAADAKKYLEERLYIPFGLAMNLTSSAEFAEGYPWGEDVTLAIDQSPSYLDTGLHVDEETGYSARTLRLRNVCLFSPSASQPSTDESTGAATDELLKKGTDVVLEKAIGLVPSGLPLLPPWGWWATLNVWYIEVQGVVPVFTVYDADVEPVPDPVFGGRAMAYTRRHEVIRDDRGQTLGMNEPIRFSQHTCTFIIVPPGPQGVGDKAGGWDEKSPGFDEKENGT